MNRLDAVEARGAADPRFGEARAVIAAAEAADGASPVSDQAMLAATQGLRSLLSFTEPTSPAESVAIGVVGQGEVDLVVRPDARGRGVGTAALDALLRREEGELKAWAHGENPAAEALLRSAGFAPVRSLFRMSLDPALLPRDGRDPLAVPAPEGFALRAFDPEEPDDADAWVRVNAAAFAEHPEQGRITDADFSLMREEAWFDPADLILLADLGAASEGNVLAGSTWIKTVREESGVECELYAVGVHPDYAGRGLGRLLLDVTLARMAEHAPDRVTLYVDGDNERAVRMYETAGFTVCSRSRQWARPAATRASARMDA